MYKFCPLECKILKGIWKNAYANDNVFCTTLYIFNFSDPYLFLRVFIFKSLSFPQSLYFLLYIISVRGVGGGVWGQSPQENFLDVCADDSVYLH